MNHAMWIALAAVVIGALVRAIKSDGAKIALANLGLPPIPTRVLPWIALVLGAVSGMLDAKLGGKSWEEAVATGVVSAASAVFGHELLSGVPGVKRLLTVTAFVTIGSTVTSCTPEARREALLLTLDAAKCAVAHLNLPDDQILKLCAIEAADADRILKIVGQARSESARAAVQAREEERIRAEILDAHRAAAGCSGYRDGGLR
jgi:hypothetical protein